MEQRKDVGTVQDLAVLYIQKAYENLNDAISLLSHNRICSAASRAYYSVFRAISAVHSLDGNQYRSHKTALAEFNKKYISNDIFPKIYGRKMYKLMQLRDISDYEYKEPDKFEVQEYVGFAKIFCEKLKEYCETKQNKCIYTEKLNPLEKAIINEYPNGSVENYFTVLYNRAFEEHYSHDEAAIISGKTLYSKGYDTVTVLTVLDAVAPKAAVNDEYACKILKHIQNDSAISNLINKKQIQSQKEYIKNSNL